MCGMEHRSMRRERTVLITSHTQLCLPRWYVFCASDAGWKASQGEAVKDAQYKNKILAALTKAEIARLQPHLDPIDLPRKHVMHEAGEKITYAYFLEEGLASVVVQLENGSTVEVGVVGREGMTGLPILMDTERIPNQAFMQVPGSGHRIKANILRENCAQPGNLRPLLLRYLHLHLVQASQTAACNRMHEVEERMARWLLICQDRMSTNEILLTHEFLAQMLGTRRSSVTLAAGILQRRGLIHYVRGRVHILDQPGLKESACECYQVIHDEQARLGLL
jgi:CRP-like cAMP-binding protein